MQIGAIIFDFNGVLVDDEKMHFQGFRMALEEIGMQLAWQDYCERYLHFGDRDLFLHFLDDHRREADLDRLTAAKTRYYFQQLETGVPAVATTVDFIRGLGPDLPLGIASAAARKEIDWILPRLGLAGRFQTVVAAEDVARGKPHPEAFEKTFAGLRLARPGLEAGDVVVVEDSYHGIDSAHAAGFACVALSTSYPAERLREAELVLPNLEGWTRQRLEGSL